MERNHPCLAHSRCASAVPEQGETIPPVADGRSERRANHLRFAIPECRRDLSMTLLPEIDFLPALFWIAANPRWRLFHQDAAFDQQVNAIRTRQAQGPCRCSESAHGDTRGQIERMMSATMLRSTATVPRRASSSTHARGW